MHSLPTNEKHALHCVHYLARAWSSHAIPIVDELCCEGSAARTRGIEANDAT
jgi:hypothetical protein